MDNEPRGEPRGAIYGTPWKMDNKDNPIVEASLIMRMPNSEGPEGTPQITMVEKR